MATIVTRAGKGSPLTNTEVDSNFINLNTDKYEIPSLTGNSGKYLTTNGTTTSWADVPAPNNGTLSLGVSGTGLSGSASFTADQSGNTTFTVASNATDANTASTLVARDASGNFSAGTITAALSGNASTATTLQTARNIQGVSFNGSADITVVTAGTGITVTGTAVSIPQAVDTSSNVQFGSFGVGTAASGTTGEIRATNNITAYYSSDARFKQNVVPVSEALSKVCAIGVKTFDWTDSYISEHGGEDGYFVQKSDFGVIAQDVQAVFPQAVRTREDGSLAVDYPKLAVLAFGAIQELAGKLQQLEAKVSSLK